MQKTILYVIIAAAVVAGAVALFAAANFEQDQPNVADTLSNMPALPDTVNVGVMLPATGDLSSHGRDNHIAVKFAAADFNDYLESKAAHWRINLIVEDTQTDPIIALEKIQSLNSKGVNLILGTETSAELRNVKSYADSNNIMMISPSSTSPKLAMPDNIFRFVPDDTQQGTVIAKLLENNDIKVVIPIYRADVWGDGLYKSSKESFERLGGMVDDGIRYSPEITVFSTEANLLSELVKRYMENGYDTSEIAILMISFSEAVHLLNSAASYDNLTDVVWFGSDASSNDDAITEDAISSKFVQDVDFVATQFSASKNEKYQRVYDHLVETAGSSPNSYAYSSYDSLWVLGLTIEATGSTDTDTIMAALPDIAKRHVGAIGNIILNDVGDLAASDYELWSVIDGEWEVVGRYASTTDTLEFS